jgi:hypothetical protein
LKARNARDGWHLEIPAVQLIMPNLPDAANYEAERERGKISKAITTAKVIGLSPLGQGHHPRT